MWLEREEDAVGRVKADICARGVSGSTADFGRIE